MAALREVDAAVVADGIHPAGQRHSRAEVSLGELGTMMGAFHGKIQPDRRTHPTNRAQWFSRSWKNDL